VRACVRLVVESVIDLFREEAGISGLREGSVKERERERIRWQERGDARERAREREKERERKSLACRGRKWRRGKRRRRRRWTSRYHTCAVADLDCPMVNARMTACSYVFFGRAAERKRKKERERERERKNCSPRCSIMWGHNSIHWNLFFVRFWIIELTVESLMRFIY